MGTYGRQLPEDLPRFVEHRSRHLPLYVVQQVERQTAERRTAIFDTHPSDSDRVRAVAQLAAPGVLGADRPATCLFADFATLARAASRRHYDTLLNPAECEIVDTDAVLAHAQARDRDYQAVEAVFFTNAMPLRPLMLPVAAVPAATDADADAVIAALRTARAALEASKAPALDAYGTIVAMTHEERPLNVALGLMEAGVPLEGKHFGGREDTPQAARELLAAIEARRQQFAPVLDPFEAAQRNRVFAALRLAQLPSIDARSAGCRDASAEIAQLLPVCAALHHAWPVLSALRPPLAAIEVLRSYAASKPEANVDLALNSARYTIKQVSADLRNALSTISYADGGSPQPLGDWLFTDGDAAVSQLAEDQGSRAIDRASQLHWRTHVRVAHLVLAVEAVVLET